MSAIYVRKFIENQRQEESEICVNRHKQKLTKLGLDISKFDANYTKTIRNPSDRKLSDVEKILLSKGLNFVIYPLYLNLIEVQKDSEICTKKYAPFLIIINEPNSNEFCLICTANSSHHVST